MNRRLRGTGIRLAAVPMELHRGGARAEVHDGIGVHATWPVIDPFDATKLLYPSQSALQAAWVLRKCIISQWDAVNGR